MADDLINGELLLQQANQSRKPNVLYRLEGLVVAAFNFNAQRKVVTAVLATPRGDTGMPSALGDGNKLNDIAISPDEEMRGHAQILDVLIA